MKKIYFLFLFVAFASNAQTNVFYPSDGSPYLQVHPGANLALVGTDMGEGVTKFELFNTDPDQSPTNEIELPAQSGQSGKFLGTDGITQSWLPITVTMSAPSYNNSITSGTAFQPSSTNAAQIVVSTVLGGGILGLSGTSVISMCATQSGTYTNIGNGTSFYLAAASLTDNKDSAMIPVPKGYWVKVTNTNVGLGSTIASTYTRWNL